MLLHWRIITSVDAAVQARKRLQRPAQSVPAAATLGAVGIVVAAVLLQSTNWLNPLAAFRAFRIPSGSMCPTLCEGDRIVTDVKAFRSQQPERGDLVMFLFDRENALHFKGVASVGGDEVVRQTRSRRPTSTSRGYHRIASWLLEMTSITVMQPFLWRDRCQ